MLANALSKYIYFWFMPLFLATYPVVACIVGIICVMLNLPSSVVMLVLFGFWNLYSLREESFVKIGESGTFIQQMFVIADIRQHCVKETPFL